MSMRWQDEQQAFWDWITRPQDLRESSAAIADMFVPHGQLSQVEALGIYNNAYHQRLIQISAELYPILYHTLGDAVYTRLWLAYLAEHPPRPGPMSLLGEHLHEFACQHTQFGKLPAMLDIIQLETLLIMLFDRADQTPCTMADLQAVAPQQWPQMHWSPRDDWALMHSSFDLEDYWARMQTYLASVESGSDATEHGKPEAGEVPFAVKRADSEEGVLLLVRRVNHRMQFQRINASMYAFLGYIKGGCNFGDICERLAEKFPREDIPALSLNLLLKAIALELLRAP